jgi:excinuclease ABC subunit B
MTDSMQKTIDETNRRREKQLLYNQQHGITPTQVKKSIEGVLLPRSEARAYVENTATSIAADPVVQYMSHEQLQKTIASTRKNMEKAARELNFIEAARLRDEMFELEKLLEKK